MSVPKSLNPVNVRSRLDGSLEDLRQGVAVLSITDSKGEVLYWAKLHVDPNLGCISGCRLTKFLKHSKRGEVTAHDVCFASEECDCGDFVYRGHLRPEGCKHLVALRQALPALLVPSHEEVA